MPVGVPNENICLVRSDWVLRFLLFYFVCLSSWKNQDQRLRKVIKSILLIFGHFGPWKFIFHIRKITFAVRSIGIIRTDLTSWFVCWFVCPSVSLVSVSKCQKSRIKVLKFRKKQFWTCESLSLGMIMTRQVRWASK